MHEHSYSRLDKAFAEFLARQTAFDQDDKARFIRLLCELSYQLNQGHSCLRINRDATKLLQASGLASENQCAPLVIEHGRLYLQRYWYYENRLAQQLLQLTEALINTDLSEALLLQYFPESAVQTDWQRQAAELALTQSLSIITGGPGTGKTTTVVKILAMLLELSAPPLLIGLAAPTGKAAMRLQQAIASSKQGLPGSETIKLQIPETVSTLHRLLGSRPLSPYFLHDRENPLPHDVLVIDEVSMVDLALMSKVVDALKPGARLILLGDKEQLSSVESGAVLADMSAALSAQTLALKKTHRFDQNIKALAEAVNRQRPDKAWQLLLSGSGNVGLLSGDLISAIAAKQNGYLQRIKAGDNFSAILHSFFEFQVLCANRRGRYSVAEINVRVEQHLAARELITLSGQWYSGRPVMVTQNDSTVQLFNGDIGICLPDPEQAGRLMVFFNAFDGQLRKFLPARLPQCETVYAMTIHKSQGSEFDEVLIVLPDKLSPILTKELVYTAITRARKAVGLWAQEGIFKQAVAQKVERFGGLREKLQQGIKRMQQKES